MVVAEIGDFRRFPTPSHLMAYVGLVRSEYSSGNRRRQGEITKAGNGLVRRVLIEAAWTYRYPARQSYPIRRRSNICRGRSVRRPGRHKSGSAAACAIRANAASTTTPC